MSEYSPDAWVVLEMSSKYGPIKKVLAGWYGGFADGDSWRLSSGIVKIDEEEHVYHIHNDSGSVYHCHKGEQRMSGLMASIYNGWMRQLEERIAEGKATKDDITIKVIELGDEVLFQEQTHQEIT